MTRKQIIALVRQLINDEQATAFTEGGNLEEPEGTQELLNYLDRAVDEYSKNQAAAKDLRLVKRLTVTNGQKLPDDFINVAGIVPILIEGGVVNFYDDVAELPIKYFARLPYVTSYVDTDELPYENDQAIQISARAAIYALNKHEFNVSQDLLLLGAGTGQNAVS